MTARAKSLLSAAGATAFVLASWELAARFNFLQGRWPHAIEVLRSLVEDWHSLALAALHTVYGVAGSLVIGVLVGLPLGFGVATKRLPGVYEVLASLKVIPVTVLIPVFLGIFGLRMFIVPLVSLPLALNFSVNTAQAIAQANLKRQKLLRSWALSPRAYLRHVLVFECLEALLQTTRIMVPFAFALHIALDYFLATPQGLGSYVQEAYSHYRWDNMYAAILLAAVIGLTVAYAIDRISGDLLVWKRDM